MLLADIKWKRMLELLHMENTIGTYYFTLFKWCQASNYEKTLVSNKISQVEIRLSWESSRATLDGQGTVERKESPYPGFFLICWMDTVKMGRKNAEADDGCNKLVLLEICSIRAEGLSHLFLLMLQCKHINLMLHQPWLLLDSGNINLQQNSSAATFSHITVKAFACGKQVPSFQSK